MDQDTLAALLDGVPLPLVVVDGEARIRAANAPARAAFGAALAGRPFITVFRQPALIEALEAALAGQGVQVRAVLPAPGGEAHCRITAAPLAGPGKAALLTFEDLTGQEQAEAMRRDFVANVSHELRTPLTALLGFIETLRGPARDDPAARERFLGIMEREAQRMNRLVQDLLSLSRVESEERQRPPGRVDVVGLLRASVAALRPMAAAAGVEIALAGLPGPLPLRADPDQITQVFANLIENAVKYGGAGGSVTIAVSREARDAALRGPAVRIAVIDRGEGIAPIHLPRLTERFYRIDSHRSREKGGTGLGLAIVKHIVNRHRGRLRIESTPGNGSVFSVILPED